MMSKRIPVLLTAFMVAILIFTAMSGCIQVSQTGYDLNLWDNGPLTMDPAISSEMSSHIYVMQIFSGLVNFDSQLKPAPDIAESWEISADGKTYTFNLRENARFHDGRAVTAADIKYSLERACYPETNSQTASTYLSDIVGIKDVLSGQSKDLAGVKAIDANTLKITIDAPKAYFLSKLAYPTAFVVDRQNVESGSNWWHKPNGTGPYKLTKFNEDALIVLMPNQYYYGTKATASVAFHILAGIPMSLYETNKIDVVQISKDYIDRAQDTSGPFANQLHIFPEFSLQYIGFNTAKPPFDDPLVRQAFCHAVDKERIIELIQKNMATKADGIIPVGMPGYNKDVKGLDFDPALAKELLSRSTYGSAEKLPPIILTTAGYGGVDVADYLGAILQDWQQNLGVTVTVRLLEPMAFHYRLKQEVDNMYALGWIADYPDPQNFLYTLFYTDTEYNDMHYSNKELDNLLDKAAIEQDYDTRMKLYRQAEQVVIEQAPLMPLWFGRNYLLISPDVHDYTIDPLGVPKLNLVTVDK
ncbi:MAG: peptide ABC transporter substrate-binding protein [Dehalococcoidia bacterium]|nr:peptide ABC transporter substrate-binding protein [Dehalococcoidia bacterium]